MIEGLPLWASLAIYALTGYLLGAIPTGYLVVKKLTGEDIRQHGSGGTGATNVRRVAGGEAARLVLLIDFFKGYLPVALTKFLLWPEQPAAHVLVAITAVIGHSKSVFLGFTGGKSAATGLGSVLGLNSWVGLILALLAFSTVKLTRIVSIGSMLAAVLAPLLFFVFGDPWEYIGFSVASGVYVLYLHRSNIARLIKGTENKLE